MNVRLLLVLGLVVGCAFAMRSTIVNGFSLLTGRGDLPHTTPHLVAETEGDDGLTDSQRRYIRESDARIRLWRDCPLHTNEEMTDECRNLHESKHR